MVEEVVGKENDGTKEGEGGGAMGGHDESKSLNMTLYYMYRTFCRKYQAMAMDVLCVFVRYSLAFGHMWELMREKKL